MNTHVHHIIPKHAGGTNDPSNLVELTIEEHAEAHRVLYEKYGRWQDKLAMNGLNGDMTTEQLRIERVRQAHLGKPSAMRGKKHSEETKRKMSKAHTGKKYGPMSEKQKKQISERTKGTKHSDETKAKMRKSQTARRSTETQEQRKATGQNISKGRLKGLRS